jgi:RNA polymerase sigma-70 factor, ECF subfamily
LSPAEETRASALMRSAQAGDESAYADLLLLLTVVAARYVRVKSGAVVWVDDVVQETLMTVHRSRHTYDSRRPFAPWFYAIVASRLIDVWRREHRVARREIGSDEVPERAGDVVPERALVDADRVRAAVRALPSGQRTVVEALKFRGETVRAASVRLGMTEAALKVRAHRGYNALRRLLGGSHRAN